HLFDHVLPISDRLTFASRSLPALPLPPPPPPALYTLSLHDALPIWRRFGIRPSSFALIGTGRRFAVLKQVNSQKYLKHSGETPVDTNDAGASEDRKSTRLNSSHVSISYAVFCLKKIIHLLNSSSISFSTVVNDL